MKNIDRIITVLIMFIIDINQDDLDKALITINSFFRFLYYDIKNTLG